VWQATSGRGRACSRHFEDELDCGQTFRNEYEQSKFEAERMIRQAGGGTTVTVLRPGIVVGDHTSGYTHAFHSFYQYVRFTWMLANTAEKDLRGRYVRLTLSGGERRNLVCVDWVSAVMTRIAQDPACRGRTFHVTPQRPVTTNEIEQALQLHFKYDGVQFVGTRPIDPRARRKNNDFTNA
jgi:nucleoside-diphosphate-sugar epimerase